MAGPTSIHLPQNRHCIATELQDIPSITCGRRKKAAETLSTAKHSNVLKFLLVCCYWKAGIKQNELWINILHIELLQNMHIALRSDIYHYYIFLKICQTCRPKNSSQHAKKSFLGWTTCWTNKNISVFEAILWKWKLTIFFQNSMQNGLPSLKEPLPTFM